MNLANMSDHEDAPPAQPQVIHVGSNLPLLSALFSLRATLLLTGNDSGRRGKTTKLLLISKHRRRNFARLRYLLASGKTLWIFMMVWPSMKKHTRKILTLFFKSYKSSALETRMKSTKATCLIKGIKLQANLSTPT